MLLRGSDWSPLFRLHSTAWHLLGGWVASSVGIHTASPADLLISTTMPAVSKKCLLSSPPEGTTLGASHSAFHSDFPQAPPYLLLLFYRPLPGAHREVCVGVRV